MDIIHTILDFLLHIEVHLDYFIVHYHSWTYLILFFIVFIETGFVIMPFLPGDSLLFAIGAIAARGTLSFWPITVTLFVAALLGDTINYTAGKFIGPKVFTSDANPLLNKNHLNKAHSFYRKYGPRAIILARFIPIVRTFAPFVAGIGEMPYKKFISFSMLGAFLWIFSFIPLGFFFGNMPIVQRNFKIVMVVIILISVMPALIEFFLRKKKLKLEN